MFETILTNLFSGALITWFKELPRPVRWLFGIAAFVILVVILFLMFGGHKSHKDLIYSDTEPQVIFEVQPDKIVFDDIIVGKSANQNITIKTNDPVVIQEIKISNQNEFEIPTNCMDDVISDECMINVIYTPKSKQEKSEMKMQIVWHLESQEQIVKTEEVNISYSAVTKKVEEKPEQESLAEKQTLEPVKEEKTEQKVEQKSDSYQETKTESKPINKSVSKTESDNYDTLEEDDDEDIIDDYDEEYDKPAKVSKPQKEIKEIARPNPFVEQEQDFVLPPEKCSDFAIPGYDNSGNQIGWIKPERGANYFHPFSDKDCSNPTGRYDLSTGVITSLTDGSKIGTDSDHIGYRNVQNRKLSVPQSFNQATRKSGGARLKSDGTFDNPKWESNTETKKFDREKQATVDEETLTGSGAGESVVSTRRYDRTFILRQFKPIPATIVSEVRADPSIYGCNKAGQNCDPKKNYSVPVRATVDRNVYSDDGRTIILPTGTLLMGYLDGELPGPYQAFGRMNIKWYQFIRPDGVEFNFKNSDEDPYSADAQGRMGVPGHGSTDYVEQMVMPILTALVPAAVNMIAPITDTVINQIDLDNNTIVQSGTIRSSEMAKQDIINTWNKITQKLLVDAIDNTVPPFSIAAGTRINVFSPVDLIVSCADAVGKKCSVIQYGNDERRKWSELKQVTFVDSNDPSWRGQIRSFDLNRYCKYDGKKVTIDQASGWEDSGYDYRTVLAYCESQNYQAINNAKQTAYNKQVQAQADAKKSEYGATWTAEDGWTTNFNDAEAEQKYNTEVLGLNYDDDGNIINPFAKPAGDTLIEQDEGLTCDDGSAPDANGCCAGETYTDMGEAGWNCCPDAGGDCFPPIEVE